MKQIHHCLQLTSHVWERLQILFHALAKAPGLSQLTTQDVGSQVPLLLDGKELEKNKEYKLSVGQTLKIGDDAVYQVGHSVLLSQATVSKSFVLATDEAVLHLQILRDARAHA